MTTSKCVVIAGALLLFCSTSWATDIEVGWIEAIQGKAEDITIRRGGKPISVIRFKTLHEGDSVFVTNATRVEIRLGEGTQSVTVTEKNSPYRVVRVGEVPGARSKLLSWLRSIVLSSVGKADLAQPRLVIAASRSAGGTQEPLSVPLFERPEYLLVAGKRNLHFAWHGGLPPYVLRLSDKQSGVVLAEINGVQDKRTMFASVDIPPGVYLLSISDARNEQRLQRIGVVSEVALPVRQGVNDMGLPVDVRALYNAAWLTGQQNGQWRLESYQQLMALNLPEAIFLREALASGEAISASLP